MSLKHEQQMNMPSTTEGEPSADPQINPASTETKTPIKTSLVPEEDLERMRTQIAGVFKDSPSLSGKNPEWKAETGMGEQATKVALFGLRHPLLVWKGVSEIFKSKKQHLREKDAKSHSPTPQF